LEPALELATEKSKAKTQSYAGPVVNRGPYDGKIEMQIAHR